MPERSEGEGTPAGVNVASAPCQSSVKMRTGRQPMARNQNASDEPKNSAFIRTGILKKSLRPEVVSGYFKNIQIDLNVDRSNCRIYSNELKRFPISGVKKYKAIRQLIGRFL
jgi:hypothetical protein